MLSSRFRGACVLFLTWLMVACGGGGGDNGPVLTPRPFQATAVARESIGVQFEIGARNLPQGQGLYVLASGGDKIFASLDVLGVDGQGIVPSLHA